MNRDIVKIYTRHSFEYDENGKAIDDSVKIVDVFFVYSDGEVVTEAYNKETHEKAIASFLHIQADEGTIDPKIAELIRSTKDASKMGPVITALFESGANIIDTFDIDSHELEEALKSDREKLKPNNTMIKKINSVPGKGELLPFSGATKLSGVTSQPESTKENAIPGMVIKTVDGSNRMAAAPEITEEVDEFGNLYEGEPEETEEYTPGGAALDDEERDKPHRRRGLWAGIAAGILAASGITGIVTNFKGWRTGIANWWSNLTGNKNNEKSNGPAYLTAYEKASSDLSSVMTASDLIEKLRPGVQKDVIQTAGGFLSPIPGLVTKDGNFYLPIDGNNYLEFTPKELIDTIVVLRNYSPSQIAQVYNGFNFSSDSIHEGFDAFYLKVMTYYMNATEPLPMEALYGDNKEGYTLFNEIEKNLLALNKSLKDNPAEFPNEIKEKLFKQFLDLALKQSEYKGKNLEASVIMAGALSDSYIFANRNIKEALVFSKDNAECGAKKGDSFYQVARIKCEDIIPRNATFASKEEVKNNTVLYHDLLQDVGYYNTFRDKLDKKIMDAEKPEFAAVTDLKSALRDTKDDRFVELARTLPSSNISEGVLDVLRRNPKTAEIMNQYDLAMNADAESRRFARYDDVIDKMRDLLDITAPDMVFYKNNVTLDKLHELQNHRFRDYVKDLGGFGFYYGINGRGEAPDTGKREYIGTRHRTTTTTHKEKVDPSTLTDEQKEEAQKPIKEQLAEENHIADLIEGINEEEHDMFADDPEYGTEAGLTGDAYDAAIHGAEHDEWMDTYLESIGYDNMTEAEQEAALDRAEDLYEQASSQADELADREEEAREDVEEEVAERNEDKEEHDEQAEANQAAYQNAMTEWMNNEIANPGNNGPAPKPEDFQSGNNNNNNGGNTENNNNNGNNGGNNSGDTSGNNGNGGSTENPVSDSDGDNDPNTGEQTYEDEEPYVPESTDKSASIAESADESEKNPAVEQLEAIKQAIVDVDGSMEQTQPEAEVQTEAAPVLVK